MSDKFKIIGLGGIGSYLIEPLCRYLSTIEDQFELTLIDGDVYEEKNRGRQVFEGFENKASHTTNRLRRDFPRLYFKSKAEYLTEDNIITAIREGDCVFLCVDNHATRKLVTERCQELDDVTLISGGNDYTDGNVIYYRRRDGEDVTKPPTELYPEIASPTDENPGKTSRERQGCDREANLNPQLLFTNLAAASCMLNIFYAHKHDRANFEQVYFDILTQRSRPTPEPTFE